MDIHASEQFVNQLQLSSVNGDGLMMMYLFPSVPSVVSFFLQVLLWSACVPLAGGLSTIFASFFPKLYDKEEERMFNKPTSNVILNNLCQWFISGSQFAVLCHYLYYAAPYHITSTFEFYYRCEVDTLAPRPYHGDYNASHNDSEIDRCYEGDLSIPVVFGDVLVGLLNLLLRVVINVHAYDFAIYWYHYAGHKLKGSFFYNAHRQHHENSRPSGFWNIIYGDLWEGGFISSFAWVPILSAPISIGAMTVYCFFIVFAVSLNHSGRDVRIPYIYNARFHQEHHISYTCNFCEHTPVWDMLFGTYRPGRAPRGAEKAKID